ncbi:hypothetical protein OH77DRAFT_1425900 [Trametes cingulata]|nr:hypothetical protein OH77DRAFT_1425900 [Trametes cingulata]
MQFRLQVAISWALVAITALGAPPQRNPLDGVRTSITVVPTKTLTKDALASLSSDGTVMNAIVTAEASSFSDVHAFTDGPKPCRNSTTCLTEAHSVQTAYIEQ